MIGILINTVIIIGLILIKIYGNNELPYFKGIVLGLMIQLLLSQIGKYLIEFGETCQ